MWGEVGGRGYGRWGGGGMGGLGELRTNPGGINLDPWSTQTRGSDCQFCIRS